MFGGSRGPTRKRKALGWPSRTKFGKHGDGLLYTSDAADDLTRVGCVGRGIVTVLKLVRIDLRGVLMK